MEYRSVKGHTGWAQLGILVAFIGAGFILAGIAQLYLGYKAIGPNTLPIAEVPAAMLKALMKPENIVYMQLSQILGTFFLMFIPSLAFILICHKQISWAGFNQYFNWKQIGLVILILFCTTAFATPFADISKFIFSHFPHWDVLAKNAEDQYNDLVKSMAGLNTWPEFFIAVFIIALLPAFFEELAFRGVLQNFLQKWLKRPIIAIIITSVFFSLIHASYYLFISRFILSFALGYIFYRSKNIWLNTFMHFINNLIGLIQLFYLNKTKGAKINVNDMDTPMPMWSVFVTGTILIALFILFEKVSAKNRQIIETKEDAEIPYSDDPFNNYA